MNDPKHNTTSEMLRMYIEKVERLEESKRGVSEDIKEVYSEAKSNGFDVKVMRQIVKLRRMETHVRQEWEAVLETYKDALGL